MDNLSDRLNFALKELKISGPDLAKKIGASSTAIANILRRGTKQSSFTSLIASALGINYKWLCYGEGAMMQSADPLYALSLTSDILPVLSHENLLAVAQGQPMSLSEENQQWLCCPKELRAAFAYKLQLPSMLPYLEINDFLFITEKKKITEASEGKVFIIYSKKLMALFIGKVEKRKDELYLCPTQEDFFKPFGILEKDIFCFGYVVSFMRAI